MGQQRTWKTTRALKSRYCLTFSTIVSPTKACLPKRGQYTSKPYIVANHDQYKENRLTFILVLHHWCCSFFFNFFPTNTLKSCLQKCECFTTNGIKYLFQLISDPQQRFVALEQGPLFYFFVTVSQSGHSFKQRIGPTTRMSWKSEGMQRQGILFLTVGLS